MSSHPLEAIETQGPVTLSIFPFFLLNLPPQTMDSRPPHTFRPSHVSLSVPPPTDNTIVLLVVVSNQQVAATYGRGSTHHSIFRWVTFRRPRQGNQPQWAQARPPSAYIDSWEAAAPWFAATLGRAKPLVVGWWRFILCSYVLLLCQTCSSTKGTTLWAFFFALSVDSLCPFQLTYNVRSMAELANPV